MLRSASIILVVATAGCAGTQSGDAPEDVFLVPGGSLQDNVAAATDAAPLSFATQQAVVSGKNPDGFLDGLAAPTEVATVRVEDVVFEIQPDEAGGYRLTLITDDETRPYFDGDGRGRGSYSDGFYFDSPAFSSSLNSLDGDWSDVFAGEGAYRNLVRLEEFETYYQPSVTSQTAYLVVGIPSTDVPVSGTMTYSGDLTNITRYGVPVAGAFTLEGGALSGGAIEARIVDDPSGCETGCLSLETGTLNGALFGQGAQEAGGIATLSGRDGDGNGFVAAGAWAAAED